MGIVEHVLWSYFLVMAGRMVFGVVVSFVDAARAPVDDELALFDSVADPVETHVNGAGALLLDVLIGNATGGRVIGEDGSGILWVPHFDEDGSENEAFLGVGKDAGDFRFAGGGHDHFDDGSDAEDSTVFDFGLVGSVTKVELAA